MKSNNILITSIIALLLISTFICAGLYVVEKEKNQDAANDIQYIIDKAAYEDSKFIEITIQIVKNDPEAEIE